MGWSGASYSIYLRFLFNVAQTEFQMHIRTGCITTNYKDKGYCTELTISYNNNRRHEAVQSIN